MFGAANRDDRRFDNPERLDILRELKRNLAFGNGIHHCIGAPLTRFEARIPLEVLLQRAPNYGLIGGAEPKDGRWPPSLRLQHRATPCLGKADTASIVGAMPNWEDSG